MPFPYLMLYGAAFLTSQINSVTSLNIFFNHAVIALRSWSYLKLVIGTFNLIIGIEQVASLCAFFFSGHCDDTFWTIQSIIASPIVHLVEALPLAIVLHQYKNRVDLDGAYNLVFDLALGIALCYTLTYSIFMAYHQSLIRAMSLVFCFILLAFVMGKYCIPIANVPYPPRNDVSGPLLGEEPDSYFPQAAELPRSSQISNPDIPGLNAERRNPALVGSSHILGSDSAGIKMRWAIFNIVLDLVFKNLITRITPHMDITSTCTKDWMTMSTLLIIRNTASAIILFAATESGPFCRFIGRPKVLSLWFQMILLEWNILPQNAERRDLSWMGFNALMASTLFMMAALEGPRNMRWEAGRLFLMFLVTSFASKIYLISKGGTRDSAAAES